MYAQKEVPEIQTPQNCVGHEITLPLHKNRNLEVFGCCCCQGTCLLYMQIEIFLRNSF